MRKTCIIALLTTLCMAAQGQVADSLDVIDCHIALDLASGKPFSGVAQYTVCKIAPCQQMSLRLKGTATSISLGGEDLEEASLDAIPIASVAVGDTFSISIAYQGSGYVESYGWGGFHFDKNMSYNLGVGFGEDPHIMASSLLPSRDSFHDKCTYTIELTTASGWSGECSGLLVQRDTLTDGREHSVWRIDQPVSSYLVGVSQAAYKRIESTVPSVYGDYPLTLAYTTQQPTSVKKAFAELDSVVPQFERCLGPYRWKRIGYIPTEQGSMEHVNNIALASTFMTGTDQRGQMTIAHELGHAWFGNLITCRTEADMWFNEGGATFCSELAMEATSGRKASDKYYQTNLDEVLRTAHLNDGGYRPLSPMPHNVTYGSTTYDKGALVWHSMRGYLGEELFYSSLSHLMENKAFGTVDAAEVRDSLSLYSGVNLTDFFNFHVFEAGFVDYYVSLVADGTALRVCTQGVGTTQVPRNNLLPVLIVDNDGTEQRHLLHFDSSDTTFALSGRYCVVDPNCELSDAATVVRLSVSGSGTRSGSFTHFRLKAGGSQPQESHIYVEHHWGTPHEADQVEGVKRVANRYWQVRGAQAWYENTRAEFQFEREGSSAGDYAHLDRDFYSQAATADSLVLLYRENADRPWRCQSTQRSGNAESGALVVEHLMTGDYTLAVADPKTVGIADQPTTWQACLFPNPVRRGEPLQVDIPSSHRFSVSIYDSEGRLLWHKKRLSVGQPFTPTLPTGTFLVRIENNNVSLQSKLIVI